MSDLRSYLKTGFTVQTTVVDSYLQPWFKQTRDFVFESITKYSETVFCLREKSIKLFESWQFKLLFVFIARQV